MDAVNPLIRTRADDQYVPSRKVPIAHLLISATSSGAAEALFTVQSGTMFEVKRLSVANVTASAATLTLHSIPSGGSIGDDNAETKGYSIAANTSVDLTDLIGGMYQAGAVLKVYAGTTNALCIHGHGLELR